MKVPNTRTTQKLRRQLKDLEKSSQKFYNLYKAEQKAEEDKRKELNSSLVKGVRISTWDVLEINIGLYKDWLRLEKHYGTWHLVRDQGSEPCGARQYDIVVWNLLPSEIKYIVKNWRECRVLISEWEEENK